MPLLVVGAPVHERGWVLRQWFDGLLSQDVVKPADIHIVLGYGPGTDDTMDIIDEYGKQGWAGLDVYVIDGDNRANREWNLDRYVFMASIRNKLLHRVREIAPKYYLSLDTDMLFGPPTSLWRLITELSRSQWNGLAPVTYMTPQGHQAINAMDSGWITRPLLRPVTFGVAACFGAVLMDEELQQVDYYAHRQGEDIGWAIQAGRMRMRLALCPSVRVKHVMNPEMLSMVDDRVGF